VQVVQEICYYVLNAIMSMLLCIEYEYTRMSVKVHGKLHNMVYWVKISKKFPMGVLCFEIPILCFFIYILKASHNFKSGF
jgi:hypothetical protein